MKGDPREPGDVDTGRRLEIKTNTVHNWVCVRGARSKHDAQVTWDKMAAILVVEHNGHMSPGDAEGNAITALQIENEIQV